jgi:DNA-binding NarL/FixJ family response regulator
MGQHPSKMKTVLIKVLVAHSRIIFQVGLSSILAKTDNIKVVGMCRSGNDAVARAINLKPEIVIVDVDISECNCFEMVKRLREIFPNIRIIIIKPASLEQEGSLPLIDLDAEAYLTDDIDPSRLINVVNDVHEGKKTVSPLIGLNFLAAYNALRLKISSKYQMKITKREIELLSYLAMGLSNQEISAKMFISANTVKVHLSTLMKKLNVPNRQRAVLIAREKGILDNC